MNDAHELGYAIHYWRTASWVEVDFVLYGERGLLAFEIKRQARVRHDDLAGLRQFRADYPMAKAFLLHAGTERRHDDGVEIVPLRQGRWTGCSKTASCRADRSPRRAAEELGPAPRTHAASSTEPAGLARSWPRAARRNFWLPGRRRRYFSRPTRTRGHCWQRNLAVHTSGRATPSAHRIDH